MDVKLKENVTDMGTWKRLLYMILFIVAAQITEFVIFLVIVAQFLLKLLTGEANGRLREFGHDLGVYVQQIICFLAFHTDDMPFPFAPWTSDGPDPVAAPGAAATKSAGKRKSGRARASRKPAKPDDAPSGAT